MKALLLSLPLILFLTIDARAQTAREVFEEVERRQNLVQNERAEIEMRIVDARGRTRNRSMEVFTKIGDDGLRRSLLVFTAPADIRGTGLLTVQTRAGDDQKLYLPAVGRVQRVTGSQRTERFAGSDFTFEDLGTRDPDQYDLRMARTTADAFIVEARPKDRDSQYGRVVLEIDRERFVIRRADHFDRRDERVKVLTAAGFESVGDNIFRANQLVMEDLATGRRTELRFTSRDTTREIADNLFTERQLQRGAR